MLRAGIVGLPNVGKSTLFNALTRTRKAEAANYPFCTIEPNVGVVTVPDERLEHAGRPSRRTSKIVPTTIEFVDIAGLVRGHLRARVWETSSSSTSGKSTRSSRSSGASRAGTFIHVAGGIDPLGDIETVKTELVLADLETVARSRDKAEKTARGGDKESKALLAVAEKLEKHLDSGKRALTLELDSAGGRRSPGGSSS